MAAAQPTLTFETFEAAGQTHLVRSSDETAALTDAARTALEESIDALLPLFASGESRLPFPVVLDLLHEPDGEVYEADSIIISLDEIGAPLGDGMLTGDSACHIRLYMSIVPHAYMPFTIVHEFGHCLQHHYLSDAMTGEGEISGWWVEGSAEWLASQVYPGMTAAALRTGATAEEWAYLEQVSLSFTDTADSPEFYGGYGSFYFWHFLETERSMDVMEMLRAMPPGTASLEDYQDFLVAQLGDSAAVMHAFGLALAQDNLTYQPSSGRMYGLPSATSGLPFSRTIEMGDDFIVDLSATLISPVEGVRAVRIVTDGLADPSGSTRMSVNTSDGGFTQVDDFSSITLCMTDEGVLARFVITRSDQDAPSLLTIHFEAASDATGCEEPPMLEVSATCAIGTWQLTNNPVQRMAADQLGSQYGTGGSPGTTILTINDDYTVNYSLENYVLVLADASQQSGGSMTMNAIMTGELEITPDFDGTLAISDFDWKIESVSAIATINGFEMDMSDVVLGAADTADTLGPTPARMECIGDQFLDWWVIVDDTIYTWQFSRVDP